MGCFFPHISPLKPSSEKDTILEDRKSNFAAEIDFLLVQRNAAFVAFMLVISFLINAAAISMICNFSLSGS